MRVIEAMDWSAFLEVKKIYKNHVTISTDAENVVDVIVDFVISAAWALITMETNQKDLNQ